MAAFIIFLFFITPLMAISSSKHTIVYASGDYHQNSQLDWMMPIRSGGCHGTIGDCLADGGDEEEELELESETNKRMLATRRRYVSYAALQRNIVPCSRRGVSYYNCRKGAPANPYIRGCSSITRCRS